jgi:F-box and leucine-rich repeat protein GRR1
MLTTFSRCELLERMTLIRCQRLESAALEATLKSWPNLVSIDLTDVPTVTNEVIVSLTETSHKLLGINSTGCKLLGDPALISLAKNCPDLCRLKMGGCDLVTDIGISAVVNGCPELLELDIHRCSGITDIAIRAVWTHSRGMRELRLSSCDALTDLAFPTYVVVDSESEDVPHNQKDTNADLSGRGESSRPSVVAAEDGAVNTDPPQSTSEEKNVASTVSLEPILSF